MNNIIENGLYFFLGVLVTGFINHYLSKDRERQLYNMMVFHEASQKFKNAFYREISYLRSETCKTIGIDEQSINRHELAMLEFREYLPPIKRRCFNADWTEYKEQESKRNIFPHTTGDTPTYENPEIVLKCIQNLLNHARYK